jgi:GH15 family glucan-1,4-alpha-glucosidase
MTDRPISEYALVSDSHSAALVSRDGSVDWLCFPRFDSPSVLGRLLGPDAGHFSIRPVGDVEIHRSYRDRTLVLETTFRTAEGVVRLVDALAVGPTDRGHGLGAGAPHALLRTVETVEGHAEIDLQLTPRPEYGISRPLLCTTPDGVVTRGGPDTLLLSSPVDLTASDGRASARFTLAAGERVGFALQWSRTWEEPPRPWAQEDIMARLDATEEAWRSWADMHQTYRGYHAELVHHSGRVLQALTFQPTGAIVAAPTTSLPERVGGVRNWDYRYSWVRDTSLTLDALWVAACPDEVSDYVRWMVGAAAGDLHAGGHLQIMFGVGGEHDLTERELAHLPGWRDSRPVRVGNAAWQQQQLDVYGELLGAVHRLAEQIGDLDQPTCDFLVGLADAAATRWQEPDQGMWEVRSGPQHFLNSKLMCWFALDRAVELAERLGVADRVQDWSAVADDIRQAILERGYDAELGAFTQAFESRALDASALMIPIVGFLPASDERVESTIRAIEEHLTDERGLVYRYQEAEDGLPGDEGTFLLCTFWLAQCHALAGRVERAKEVFDLAAGFRNDVDLLAEEVDPVTGEQLGNFPQAFSHIGLVNAAWAIDQAQLTDQSIEPRSDPTLG